MDEKGVPPISQENAQWMRGTNEGPKFDLAQRNLNRKRVMIYSPKTTRDQAPCMVGVETDGHERLEFRHGQIGIITGRPTVIMRRPRLFTFAPDDRHMR